MHNYMIELEKFYANVTSPNFPVMKKTFDNVQNSEMKSVSGFNLAMASQRFIQNSYLS